ncbi:hypothetical protein FHS29_000317 [Saccharothrix tamanrassetensis]|uniref:PPM-type phosphatase domain-containing protein n=1 Tax=Saccharothrix tamanrassetensis TaxID=1051531 RepID=A0A841CC42_9PSEU|nr:PP2C family protein-serine/threonine phosphatase [Saccharothrix tamanrassetensis]MBB5953747.1 hypothetical protein [Saccharothrix tamanrassetensis]
MNSAGPGQDLDRTRAGDDVRWHAVLGGIIDASHVASADELAGILGEATARVGISVRLYLVDLAQQQLHPVDAGTGPSLPVASSDAGRAYRELEIVAADAPPQLWLPVLNGTERLGVVHLTLPAGADPTDHGLRARCWTLSGLIGHLVQSKLHYSDLFHVVRRTRPLTVAAELLWQLLPPQTFACDRLVVTASLEPYDQVGGDGYDYAVDADRAHLAIFDAMGHDMNAGLTTTIALAATRNARRTGLGLVEAAALADRHILAQNPSGRVRFATAVLARLDLATGRLEYVNAGHPPPLLFRDGKVVGLPDGPVRPPLGLGHLVPSEPRTVTGQLRPGDRVLLHSDGITEARSLDGEPFGHDRLVELTERHEAAGLPAPETLRRITRAVLQHQRGRLQDDATLLLVEWSPDRVRALLPTV